MMTCFVDLNHDVIQTEFYGFPMHREKFLNDCRFVSEPLASPSPCRFELLHDSIHIEIPWLLVLGIVQKGFHP
jgi:hypothetical protein